MKSGGTLQRRTPLRPGTKQMSRGTGFKPAEPKPAKGQPRQKKCAVKDCREKYTPDPKRPFVRWCSPECGEVLALAAVEAKKRIVLKERRTAAKVERRKDGERREALKTYPQLVKEAQREFNAYIRLRDASQPCICCGRVSTNVDGLYSHGWDAGHYRSTGSAPHLRFNEDNVHKQLVYCNRDQSGNAVAYRLGLIARIGLARVEALEADNTPRKWTHDELRAIKRHYREKAKRIAVIDVEAREVREIEAPAAPALGMKKEAACNP